MCKDPFVFILDRNFMQLLMFCINRVLMVMGIQLINSLFLYILSTHNWECCFDILAYINVMLLLLLYMQLFYIFCIKYSVYR